MWLKMFEDKGLKLCKLELVVLPIDCFMLILSTHWLKQMIKTIKKITTA